MDSDEDSLLPARATTPESPCDLSFFTRRPPVFSDGFGRKPDGHPCLALHLE